MIEKYRYFLMSKEGGVAFEESEFLIAEKECQSDEVLLRMRVKEDGTLTDPVVLGP